MFLKLLNPAQQSLFFELARAVTEEDGLVADSEDALLAAVQAECAMDEVPAVREFDAVLGEVAAIFDPGPARSVLILELAGVALIDGEAHPAETGIVAAVADTIEVSPRRLAECFAFADRARTLIADGQTLIATADGAS